MIVVVGGIKGGCGKTTIATNLAVLRAKQYKVLLIDADEQKSAYDWYNQREDFHDYPISSLVTIPLSGKTLYSQIQKMISDYDDIIIDVGGRDTTSQRSALTIADKFLIPFQPSGLDVWTIGNVKSMISEMSAVNPKLQCYAIINRADAKGSDNKEALEIISECTELKTLPSYIVQRKAFKNAATSGLGVSELRSIDHKAIHEIKSIYDFIYMNSLI